ncbi:NAD(+) diphosphatase [Actinokineospora sp. NBRC 105648]|uniref:NAD(+) diphosphatase n=1 Tax=Actinokineospora sp. NBRC 105648 TaxID=3032206 RepID=UPI00249FF4A3|nr:NAD(+) diphosphatase [Actinokineospora sp. NBRC 105648]GLZ40493.1 NADH pyrophosphatase [Actinokineospora sp. NBRC 105648]
MTPREPFQLGARPTLSRATVQRDETARKDDARLDRLWKAGQVLLVDAKGRTPVRAGGTELVLRPAALIADTRPPEAMLLGEEGDTAYWALSAVEPIGDHAVAPPANAWGMWPGARSESGEEWHDLRGIGALLDDTDAGLFTTAVGLANWHSRASFCAKCGAPVERTAVGWATHCTGCGREEYPRTDPAVICLVHDGADQVLLARQPIWPADRYSVLAGFVETGESLEACVEREIAEEVGVQVSDIRYLGSQPWPFPRSIMIGFSATADPSEPFVLADGEIEEARWVSRDEIQRALAAGGQVDGLILPGETSIARQMIAGWAL